MKELLDPIDRWRRAGIDVVVARVVGVDGSGPRGVGAAMAVNGRGEVAGSLSGGCIEAAVVTEAPDVLRTGTCRHLSFGPAGGEDVAVGLTCGGTLHLLLEPWAGNLPRAGLFDRLVATVQAGDPVVLATVVRGPGLGATLLVMPSGGRDDGAHSADGVPRTWGSLGDPELDRRVALDALDALAADATVVRRYGPRHRTSPSVLVASFAPAPRMLVFGAMDFSAALAQVAQAMGYRVTVCDPRRVFATRARFPLVDELVVDWPDRLLDRIGAGLTPRDAICVLTHDAKFDVPALVAALRTGAGYIGAMGSRRTQVARARRLRDTGVDERGLARVHSPIGLDLGGSSPEETAVSICAEIVAARHGRSYVCSLRDSEGPIH